MIRPSPTSRRRFLNPEQLTHDTDRILWAPRENTPMIRRNLFAVSLLCLLGHAASAVAPNKPNVLVILADDLGYGELECQGFTHQIPTPNIDSIAHNGVRFTSGYVSCPYCSPSRAGLMTGRYPTRFGHEFNPEGTQNVMTKFGLPLSETTIADRLKPAGYATGWFGKSHLGYAPRFHPLKRGFDEFYGFLAGWHSYLDAEADDSNPILRDTTPTSDIDGYTTDAFAREAVKFIDDHQSEPWFCYLAFNAVHLPLQATDKYLSRFPNIKRGKRHRYAAMQSAMDDAVGSVLAKVRELGQEENTLIFFYSDNGGPTTRTTSRNGPLRGFKGQTWEGGIRVPFMVQWKDHIPAGKVDDRPVIQLDIHPTALAAAGVAVKPEWKLDGVNLLPYLTGEQSGPPHDALYWRFGAQVAIRKGDWKLVKGVGCAGLQGVNRNGQGNMDDAELYDLSQDIGEKTNLAEQEPAKVKALAAEWDRWNRDNVDPKWIPVSRAANRARQAK